MVHAQYSTECVHSTFAHENTGVNMSHGYADQDVTDAGVIRMRSQLLVLGYRSYGGMHSKAEHSTVRVYSTFAQP